ncbi:geranylgeranyl pyrophosphate synthase [Agromyces badenianii]|uniref:Geranylgeranyl pyrophosphate synthase n=1 Tax=Agromyces badenianii TaxID=2080742 RepID=A0A2S0WZM8_9MICO|nr:polyprenyl synthetase family protein [Agromyces badenianii]AWB96720.1 geranylgeranyl pyrophosphate synthase [Agromyces badenianii]PWC03790.1 polyprenyl synthetase family protein [Agromyces badenianii]
MKPSHPVARRGSSLAANLGLSERVFASSADKAMAKAIDAGLDRVEAGLLDEVRFADTIADVSTRYLLEAGGKRVRPMLTLLTAQLGAGVTDDVVTAAEAIEITHLASLYHDDVMDEADRRRGVPSAQAVWGNSVAILTGDLLFARASQLMAGLGEGAIRMQANTFERLVLGQLHETVGPQPGDDPIAHYIQVLADKTGSLIAAAAQSGIIFSGADLGLEAPIIEFGEKIGVAFQLVDDVIDLSPQPAETGKVPGTDLRAGVVTLPMLRLAEHAKTDEASAALLERIERDVVVITDPAALGDPTDTNTLASRIVPSRETVDAIVAELREHEATRATLAEARRWAGEAVAALAPLPEGSVKKALTRFAETVVERES